MPILEVINLKKRFGQLEVLRGVYLSMEKGEVLAVIGMATGEKIKIDEKTERAAVISVRAKGEDT